MNNNETMRRLRWALSLDDADAARLMALGGLVASPEDAAAWRRRDDDPDARPCPDAAVTATLDGLVRERRGPPPAARASTDAGNAPPPERGRVNNNAVLKALRIALQLRAEDVAGLVRAGTRAPDASRPEPTLSASEVGSLLRRPGSRNYRRCGDQVLRRFLVGLALRERGESPDATGVEAGPAERAAGASKGVAGRAR